MSESSAHTREALTVTINQRNERLDRLFSMYREQSRDAAVAAVKSGSPEALAGAKAAVRTHDELQYAAKVVSEHLQRADSMLWAMLETIERQAKHIESLEIDRRKQQAEIQDLRGQLSIATQHYAARASHGDKLP